MFSRAILGLTSSIIATVVVGAYTIFPATIVLAEEEPVVVPEVVETPPAATEPDPGTVEPTTPDPAGETPPATPAEPPVVEQPPATTPGPQQPPGDASETYVYNPVTKLWENAYYSWDPITKQTKPKTQQDYSFNPATGHWDTTEWVFNPATNSYQPNVVSTPTPALTVEQEQMIDSLPSSQGDLLRALLMPSSLQGPQSSSTVSGSSSSNGFFDLFHNASISNTLDSTATTGDATVSNNTLGGSATSGNAQAVANLFNVLNSSLGVLQGSNPLFFMANILGNVFGDLLINPGELPATGNSQQLTDSNLKVNTDSNAVINNDINLVANSGAATVAGNTQAGSATTGNAYAMANVINSINSAIGSGQSFMGMINIYGNLNGDILLPPGFINSLLASNAQQPQIAVAVTDDPYNPVQNNSSSQNNSLAINDTSNIANNLTVTAASGAALVGNNTTAGNATSGSANTNVTLLNLTGKQVVGKNALLVFVNVLGSWVGLIMNAPNGVTAGVIGDSGASVNNLLNSATNSTTDINANTTSAINNNINVTAQTGDATVANNTTAGNATSGDAYAAVNVLNMNSSTFSLSDWFGILFINVLGTWYGSFGVNTDAGDNPVATPPVVPFIGTTKSSAHQTFSFVPTSASSGGVSQQEVTAVLAETNDNNGTKVAAVSTDLTPPMDRGMSVPWLAFALALILLILFGDRIRNLFASRRIA